jgi:dolichyl-phosphate beta-glucosyltransferase
MASAAIVVPCYNEEHRLDIPAFRNFASLSHKITFLFVNDGSTDDTLALLKSLQSSELPTYSVLNLERNCGKGEAVRRGILAAVLVNPDYVGFWDADLATPLGAIVEFIDLAERRRDLEIIIGSRVKLLGRKIERRPSRHYLGRVFASAVSLMLGLAVYDTQCGAKLFRTSSVGGLFHEPFVSKWIFDVEILARLIRSRRGTPMLQPEQIIYEFPLREWRDVPGSKLTYGDFAQATRDLFRIWNRYLRNGRPA